MTLHGLADHGRTAARSLAGSIALSFLLLRLLMGITLAQEPEPPTLTPEVIQSRIDAVTNDAQLEEAVKTELLANYRQALQDLTEYAQPAEVAG